MLVLIIKGQCESVVGEEKEKTYHRQYLMIDMVDKNSMPQRDICTHLVQRGSLHQLERGRVYAAAFKAHILFQLLLFPSIYLTEERRTTQSNQQCCWLCTQTMPILPLIICPSSADYLSALHTISPPSGFLFLEVIKSLCEEINSSISKVFWGGEILLLPA